MNHATRIAVVLALASIAAAQVPPAGGSAPAAAAKADPVTVLTKALGSTDFLALSDASRMLAKAGAEGRAQLRGLRERLGPAAAAVRAATKDTKPDPKAAPPTLDDAARTLLADLVGSDAAKADAAAKTLSEQATSGNEAARLVVNRADTLFNNFVLGVFRTQQATNAIYAGQYKDLSELGPGIADTLAAWSLQPPGTPGNHELRRSCVRALRDVVQGEAPESVRKALEQIAGAKSEVADVQNEARCALAQFGNRSFIDPQIEALTKAADGQDGPDKAIALQQLCEIHYQMRDYEKAIAAYQKVLALLEGGQLQVPREGVGTLYYNAACSMSLAGKVDDAFAMLDRAIEAGRKSGRPLTRALFDSDHDINALRQDPRFADVLAKVDGKVKPDASKKSEAGK